MCELRGSLVFAERVFGDCEIIVFLLFGVLGILWFR